MITSIERQTMKKVYLRLLPFCFVLYFICYLDRVNIGFAALTMNKDLGLSSYIFGLGAGAFFWGYFHLGGAEQFDPRPGRRAALDRPHNGHLGPGFGRVCVHQRTDQLFHPALSARARRSGLLPRHDPIFHLLVPALASCPHRRRLHGGDPGIDRARRARFRHPSSSSTASSASLGGDGCSSARRLPR